MKKCYISKMRIASILMSIVLLNGWLPVSAGFSCGSNVADVCCCQPVMPQAPTCCGSTPTSASEPSSHDCSCSFNAPSSPFDQSPAVAAPQPTPTGLAPAVAVTRLPAPDAPDVNVVVASHQHHGPAESPPLYIQICSLLQ